MSSRHIQASTFKATCLHLLDEVAETGQTIVVTKHGRPVARLMPLEESPSTAGSVTILTHGDDLFTTGEQWDADR